MPDDNDEITSEIVIDDITPVDGIVTIELDYESTDTAKIATDNSVAHRIDNAYVGGFNEGFLHGQFKILELTRDILKRAGNSDDDANDIVNVIANHSGILTSYQKYILTHKNNF